MSSFIPAQWFSARGSSPNPSKFWAKLDLVILMKALMKNTGHLCHQCHREKQFPSNCPQLEALVTGQEQPGSFSLVRTRRPGERGSVRSPRSFAKWHRTQPLHGRQIPTLSQLALSCFVLPIKEVLGKTSCSWSSASVTHTRVEATQLQSLSPPPSFTFRVAV